MGQALRVCPEGGEQRGQVRRKRYRVPESVRQAEDNYADFMKFCAKQAASKKYYERKARLAEKRKAEAEALAVPLQLFLF